MHACAPILTKAWRFYPYHAARQLGVCEPRPRDLNPPAKPTLSLGTGVAMLCAPAVPACRDVAPAETVWRSVDQFESVFESASKASFLYEPRSFARALVVADTDADHGQIIGERVRRF